MEEQKLSIITRITDFLKRFTSEYSRACESTKNCLITFEGSYKSAKNQKVYVALRIRGKRGIIHRPVLEVFNDKILLQAIHPSQTAIIGYLARKEEEKNIRKYFRKEKEMAANANKKEVFS